MRSFRRSILPIAIVGTIAVTAVAPAPATAQSSLSSTSSGSSSSSRNLISEMGSALSDSPNPDPAPKPKPKPKPKPNPKTRTEQGLDVEMLGDLMGKHQPNLGIGAVDLGIMVPLINETFAVVFGDSFTGKYFGEGKWLSPVGLVAKRDENGRIIFTRPLNDGKTADQLINYKHYDNRTVIPSDVINLDGTLYMQGMWNEGIGNVRETEIWKSTDYGANWTSVARTPYRYMNGLGNLISWEKGPDGYIYVVSSEFRRDDPVYLSRFREEQIADRYSWEIYDPSTGEWSTKRRTPILSKNVEAGEMSLRMVEGHWVLAMFNEETASIEVRISKTIARDWNSIEPARVVVAGSGGWRAEQNASNFTQLYGGYIVPGSTLANMDLVVSQWNTSDNSRYMSTQFNVKGLDKFFGISPEQPESAESAAQGTTRAAAQTGDQSAVVVDETAVSPEAVNRLSDEEAMEKAADNPADTLN